MIADLAPRVEDRLLDSDEEHDDNRRGQKSADAYRTISEVADDLKLPQHVLRFWESKFKQITPMKRAGGRRFYRPQDVELIKRIHYLLYTQGYTIKGVQKLLAKDRHLMQSVPTFGQDTATIAVSDVLQRADTAIKIQHTMAANEQPHHMPSSDKRHNDEQEAKRQADLRLLLSRLKELRGQFSE